ncbi:alpha/beta fold hydrolase [Pseudorhodoplanes sp.]|uniref:alpha/beta fold hydrolase n=1 Tax=Pseudorhodoplanes sp. TaxID=1934341 RepID=UPI00391B43BB
MPDRVVSRFFAAADGLSLHVRCYEPDTDAARLPLLCLPGLTRNEADFELLALHLSRHERHPRRVFALDSRGRGRSGYDADWRNYNPAVELSDLVAVLNALRQHRCVFLGTSRGGILTMLLATVHPEMIAGAILNDIGPVIERAGLLRIKGYAGKMPRPRSLHDGASILRGLFGAQFPALDEDGWRAWAERTWKDSPEGLVTRYDPALAETLKDIDPDAPVGDLWAQFEALPRTPLMAIRGALSDILSVETFAAMRARRPDIDAVEIDDQGHAPLLAEPAVMTRISDFLVRCDEAAN